MLHNRYQIRGAKTNRPTSKLHYWRRGGVPGNTGAEHWRGGCGVRRWRQQPEGL